MMAHAFADDRYRNMSATGNAGPGMAGHIQGEGYRQPQRLAYPLEVVVDAMGLIDILAPFVLPRTTYDGKQIGGVGP